jgi:2-iminobutanoate/2-iminopropanoate deaminase
VGPYSPGILAGDYLYVSGQGAKDGEVNMAVEPAAQIRQTLDNVRAVVEAAGLTLGHIVYTHVYLKDLSQMPILDAVCSDYFEGVPPARAVVGVADLPGTPVEINAVAVVDRSEVRPVALDGHEATAFSAGTLNADRLYVSSLPGPDGDPAAQAEGALDAFAPVVRAAGLELDHVVFVNPYLTPRAPRAMMEPAAADPAARTSDAVGRYGPLAEISLVAVRTSEP